MSILRIRDKNGDVIDIPAFKGEQGPQGEKGDSGVYVGSGDMPDGYNVQIDPDGEPGDSLITEEELHQVKQEILNSLNYDIFGTVNEDNNIIINAALADGTYILKYENQDGTLTEIGTLAVGEETPEPETPTYTNLIPTALTHTDLSTVFNGTGYKNGTYASSSSPYYGEDINTVCTGCIPVTFNSVFYISGITFNSEEHSRFGFTRGLINGALSIYKITTIPNLQDYITIEELANQYYKITFNADYLEANCPYLNYMWFSGYGTGEKLIVATTPIF